MDNYNSFVGGLSGVFKGCKASLSKGITNITNLQKLKEITERNEVTVLSWGNKEETQVLIGYGNQLVKIFDLSTNTFTFNEHVNVGEGPVRGLFKLNGSLVTAVESGVIKVWSEKETTIETGGPLTRMRQNSQEENIMGTGGKENDLKLWDIETKKNTFVAKNVRHDELELRVPVWVMDLAFVPNTKQVAVATRYGHVRLYDPSTPTRRPVCQVTVKDTSFTCVATSPRDHHVVVGCTTGNMYLVDLRGKGLLLNKYRGFAGSVRQVACPTTEPYIVSVSLDRHLRVHHLHTKKLLIKEYMQSRLSALLLKSSFTMEDIKEEKEETNEEESAEIVTSEVDDEYEQMFEEMEVITDDKTVRKKEEMEVITDDKTVRKKLKSKNKRIKNVDNNSEEESENDRVKLTSEEEKLKEKRPRTKTKPKKLKKHDGQPILVS